MRHQLCIARLDVAKSRGSRKSRHEVTTPKNASSPQTQPAEPRQARSLEARRHERPARLRGRHVRAVAVRVVSDESQAQRLQPQGAVRVVRVVRRGGRPAFASQGRRQGPAVVGARARRGGVPRRRRLRGDALGETDAGPPRGPLAAHGHGPLPESGDGRRPPERRVHARDRRAESVSRGAGAGSVSYAFDFVAMASSSAPHR